MINADEAKLLMGFPAHYVILGNQEERFKQEGNAVTPCTAEMIGRAVIESLS
jgi:site-specific DNA-cytosine methylase